MKKYDIWDPYKDFQQTTLSNGLMVHSAFWNRPCIHVRISVQSGSLCDPKGKEGLAHFVEHMLNSKLEKDERIIASLGGEADFGRTFAFFTEFTFTVSANRKSIVKAFRVFEEMLGNVPSEIFLEKERSIVLQEFHRAYPLVIVNELKYKVFQNTYRGTLFEDFMGGLGVPEKIETFSIDDVQKFFVEHYVPSNMSVLVAGGLEHGEAVKYVQENFSSLLSGEKVRMRHEVLSEIYFPKNTEVKISLSELIEGVHMDNVSLEGCIIVPGSFSYENMRICRSNLRKILMHEIREKKHATYDIDVSCDTIGGCYDLTINTMFNHKHLEMVKKILTGSFEKMRNRKIFERTRKDLVVGYQTIDSSMKSICINAQRELVKFGRIISGDEEITNLQAVSFEEYCKLVDYLADPKRWWTLIQVP